MGKLQDLSFKCKYFGVKSIIFLVVIEKIKLLLLLFKGLFSLLTINNNKQQQLTHDREWGCKGRARHRDADRAI